MATTTADETGIGFVDRLHGSALATAGALIAAAGMLVLGILANLGFYEGAAGMMAEWHLFFSLTPAGIIAGMIEAAVIAFVVLFVFSWTYNALATRSPTTE